MWSRPPRRPPCPHPP
ncbi:hypothetical protein RDI58_032803 [Solanum bulbocastanum]|uniref:Uncharacterized protein n=1 Tax=Solanum bulbocastanum TaxID=147425 RepID=A0AAN8SP05_SOLBU